MKVRIEEVVHKVIDIFHGVIELSTGSSFLEICRQEVSLLLINCIHFKYKRVGIKLEQIVDTAYLLQCEWRACNPLAEYKHGGVQL